MVTKTKEALDLVIKKEVSPVIAKADKLAIANAADMKSAAEMLSQINQFSDRVTEEKERVTKPLNEALKAERSRWKPIETILDSAISTICGKMTAYQTEQVRLAKEEEERIAARTGSGKGKFSTETAVRKIEEIDRPDEQVATDSGMVKFRTVKKLVIDDEKSIPRAFLLPNEKAIKEALEKGTPVAGCKLIEEQVPVNFR